MKKFIYIILIFIFAGCFNSFYNTFPVFNSYSIAKDGFDEEYCSYKIYSNPDYRVILRYPKKWVPNLSYGTIDNIPLSYGGDDGYFIINAAAGNTVLEDVIKNEAYHKAQPYGSSPVIERVNLNGREGAYILPSADQPPSMKGQAAYIVKYPKSIKISNGEYEYLILYVDKSNIKAIAETLILLKM